MSSKKLTPSHSILAFLTWTSLMIVTPVHVFGADSTFSSAVSATIIGSGINSPALISPQNNSVTNNPKEPFVFSRSSNPSGVTISHYDLFLDSSLFASSISDSLTSQDYYFFTVSMQNGIFTIYPKNELTQGYHYWSVTAFSSSLQSAGTNTWQFYIDSIPPYITLNKVGTRNATYDTRNPSSIPSEYANRRFSVTTPNPVIKGTTEPFSNIMISLICPQNIPNCTTQSQTSNTPSGNYSQAFKNLIPNKPYTVYVTSTDSANNQTTLPPFILIYEPVQTPQAPTPSTKTPLPETPEAYPFPDASALPPPPQAPTPPPPNQASPIKEARASMFSYILILCFGLPLFVFLQAQKQQIPLHQIPHFVMILFFPFFFQKRFQTVPFASLTFIDPNSNQTQTTLSTTSGFYSIHPEGSNQLLVKITTKGRKFKTSLINSDTLSQTCLVPLLEKPHNAPKNNLGEFLISMPLIIGLSTSTSAFILTKSLPFLIYQILCILITYGRYIHR